MSLKFKTIDLFQLRNNEYYQFFMEYIDIVNGGIISRITAVSMSDNINSLLTLLKEQLKKLDNSLMYLSKSEYTKLIVSADDERDTAYRGFTLYVEAYLHGRDEAKYNAAQRLEVLISNYGDFRKRPYNDQTAVMDNFIEDLRSKHMEDINTIAADYFYGEMKETNQEFKDLMGDRHEERVTEAREDVRQLRSQINELYYQTCSMLEVGNLLSEGNNYTDIIKRINERIDYYSTTLAIRKGRADANKDEETEE